MASRRRLLRGPLAADHAADAEAARHLESDRMEEVDTDLRQVVAIERAGVQVDQELAASHHVLEERVATSDATLPSRLPGKLRFRSRRSGM
jgi:hypothetical protein